MKYKAITMLFFICFFAQMTNLFSHADPNDPRNTEVRVTKKSSSTSSSVKKSDRALLIEAIDNGNLDMVKEICLRNPDCVNARDRDDNISLHYAAESKHASASDIIDYLIFEAGASLNATEKHGYTPLDIAYEYGTKEVQNYLEFCNARRSKTSKFEARKLIFGEDEDDAENTDVVEEEDDDDDESW